SRVTYVESQPWPYPSSLMIGCLAEAPDRAFTLDPREIEAARWFTRAEAERLLMRTLDPQPDDTIKAPPPIAIAHHLLAYWVQGGA
ncbi:MAG: NADH pyrophosphatase, partial [Sphingomonadales bacterium]